MKKHLWKKMCVWALGGLSGIALGPLPCAGQAADSGLIVLRRTHYTLTIAPHGFRYALLRPDGRTLLPASPSAGLVLLKSPVVHTELLEKDSTHLRCRVTNDVGITATVDITLYAHYLRMAVAFEDSLIRGSIVARTGGLSPAYGLADHAGFRAPYSTEVSGIKSQAFGARSDGYSSRLVSNLVVFPRQGLACINLEPGKKILQVSQGALIQGTVFTDRMPALYYFIGSPKELYAGYLDVRNQEGYRVYKPKYAWFGVGWEAFGALGWNTNHRTVTEDVDHYLKLGFPLRWMVVGSGFWPNEDPRYFATTSFGYWDTLRYPDPRAFIRHFHEEGLKFIIGLRIAFIPHGPYTGEGLAKGYFIQRDGQARLFRLGFPRPECYFLDAHNPAAVRWYVSLCDKWKAAGVDGYKEDLYGYETEGLPDDKLDAVNAALMDRGVYIMGRNGYVGSPADLHRYNDFNYNQDQDRGPVNGLALAYSGFPYVYPDIIGGTGLTSKQFGGIAPQQLGQYLMREAQYAALNPSMSFGYGPWNLPDSQVTRVCLQAALLHDRLHPYMYSAAIHTWLSGFPYTMTPLPLAYPDDSMTYYRENAKQRGYQWMIGEALMAVPLYGNDYATAHTRDVYLPAGTWIDYDNGKAYQGPRMLKNFPLPVDKTPLFVGGTGFVVEQEAGKLLGRLYATGFRGETTFYGKDGQTRSRISISYSGAGQPVVRDQTTGQTLPVSRARHAWTFVFTPGHDYQVR